MSDIEKNKDKRIDSFKKEEYNKKIVPKTQRSSKKEPIQINQKKSKETSKATRLLTISNL